MPSCPQTQGPLIYLYGYYGCGNLGDEFLLSAAVSGILKRWPEARFRVRNLGAIAPEPRLAGRIKTTGIERLIVTPGRSRIAKVIAYLKAANRDMRGCRCMVLGGGTLLHAKESAWSLILLTALMLMARVRGMRVLGLGVGAAHLDRWPAPFLARRIVAMMDDIAVRDEVSMRQLPPSEKVRLTADLVYAWWPAERLPRAAAASKRIVVSLWSIPPHDEAAIFIVLAGALAELTHIGLKVRFLVFQDLEADFGGLTDRTAIGKVRDLLTASGIDSEIVHPGAAPDDICEAFRGAVLHVGARFHASVVASLLGVPSVGLVTDPKVSSLCEAFDMPWLAAANLSQVALTSAMRQALVQQIDGERLALLRQTAEENFAWFEKNPATV